MSGKRREIIIMKRKLAAGFLAAFTAATLMLGGCGKSEDEASDQAKATSEAGSGEQTASAEARPQETNRSR